MISTTGVASMEIDARCRCGLQPRSPHADFCRQCCEPLPLTSPASAEDVRRILDLVEDEVTRMRRWHAFAHADVLDPIPGSGRVTARIRLTNSRRDRRLEFALLRSGRVARFATFGEKPDGWHVLRERVSVV